MLVEFALVTPLLLLILLGGAQIGLLLIADLRLEHAVMEGVVAGAGEESVPERCATAIEVTEVVLGHPVDDTHCSALGNLLTVQVTSEVRLIVPLWGATFPITVEESAVIH